MPRTVDLKNVRRTFEDVLSNGDAAWDASQNAPAARQKTVAEDIFLRYVIGWEAFVSEWFIACVNHDSTRLKQSLEKKMNSWLAAEFASSPYAHATKRNPRTPQSFASASRGPVCLPHL